jgi:thymidine kinase
MNGEKMDNQKKTGQLVFEYAVMNTGKSTKLLQINFNYKSIGKSTMIIKPSLDTRSKYITSRLGLKEACESLDKSETISSKDLTDINVILVDEAQFLTKEQVLELREIADETDIKIICFGLKTNFMGELFEGSNFLLAHSDKLIENKTLCHCGSKATMVLKFDENNKVIKHGKEIDCGSEEKYISVCHRHWTEGKIK